jgi:cytosine/uracil/thiamine/allantoin permease
MAIAWWGSDAWLGALVIVPLVGAALLVMAADERKRAKRFYDDNE